MTRQATFEQFERRLIELDFPPHKIPRKLEDLSDHLANFKRTALKDGLAEPDAEARAVFELGDPITLAEAAALAQRDSAWWARHPILGYIVLPAISLLPAFAASVLLMLGVALLVMKQDQWQTLFQNARSVNDVKPLFLGLFQLQFVVLSFFALPFCWMARRSGAGLLWACVACGIFAFQGMFFHLNISARNVSPGYGADPHWLGLIGPLLIASAGFVRRAMKLNRLPPVPPHLAAKHPYVNPISAILNTPLGEKPKFTPLSVERPRVHWFKRALRTPTYWIIIILLFVIFPLTAISIKHHEKIRAGIRAKNAENDSPANRDTERAEVTQEIADRQKTRETTNEFMLDLAPHINVQLNESVDGKKGLKENSLLELPGGKHIFGGIPFNVQGRVQLMGRGLEQWKRIFPVAAKDIKVGRKCAHIFLFHGEAMANNSTHDQAVAKLIVHYADDSQSEIEIKSGVHLLDWWGPIFKSGANPDRRNLSSPDSELAWVGKNEWIKRYEAEWSLRLYKSTFDNPQPAKEVVSIDYISEMTQAAPFLLGLTVE